MGPRFRRGFSGARRARRASGRRASSGKWKAVLVFVIVLALFFYIFQIRLRPMLRSYASSEIRNQVYQIINGVVENMLTSENITYDDLVTLEKDSDGRVSAITTNMAKMNTFKTQVADQILKENETFKRSDIKIPIGNLMGSDLLLGRGPCLSIRMIPFSSINATYSNSFTSAGINQTRHQIMMNFSAKMGMLMPGNSEDVDINVDVCIAETVIVGATPQFFASIGQGNLEGLSGAEQS